jgi:competence protein ComEA
MDLVLSRVFTRKEQFVVLAASASICLGAVVIAARHLWRASGSPDPPIEAVEDQVMASVATNAAPDVVTIDLPPEVSGPCALADTSPPRASVTVSVRGAVESPGVYEFTAGGRVKDLVARAGGTVPEADISDINLAAPLLDGTTLHVPRRATGTIANGRLVVRGGTSEGAANPPEYTISRWRPPEPASLGPNSAGAGAPFDAVPGLININTGSQKELDSLPGVGPVTAAAIMEYRRKQPFRTVEDLIQVRGIGPRKMEALRPLVTVGP